MNVTEDELFLRLREESKRGRDPACADEVLALLLQTAEKISPNKILEIGAGEGLTSIALLSASNATATAIELDGARAAKIRVHCELFSVSSRMTVHEGDADEILPMLGGDGEYDIIFLDGPKVQYRRYLPDCKRLLRSGGYLFSDDVLLYGWVEGEPPKKRRMLVEHIREYLYLLESDPDFTTEILHIGEGLAVSVKK